MANEENMAWGLADKGESEIWCKADGVVLRILAPENSVVPVGYVLAAVSSPREEMPDVEGINRALPFRLAPAAPAALEIPHATL